MPIYYQRILAFFLSCFVSLAWAADANSEWYKLDSNNQVILKVEMFLSSTCPHCQKADAYFKSIEPQNKWLEVNRHYIDKDKNALETFSQYLNQQNSTNFSVPAILFCNTRWVGFSEADNSGKAILQGLELCRRQIEKRGVLTANTISILDTMATTSMMEASLEEGTSASPQVLLPLMALIDALNPCASIMVMLLFAFLIVNKEQRLLTAVLFLLPVGLIHLIQQSQTVYFYSLLPWLRVPAIALGVALSAFVYYLYERRNLRVLVFLGISFFTALAAQVYQQGCWPNLSLIFKQWLEAQDYSNMKQHLFYWHIIHFICFSLAFSGC